MVYELRKWFGDEYCLFTDDPRLRDYVVRQREVRIVGRYFKDLGTRIPIAWDICGERATLVELARRFERSSRVNATG
jgi:hypothetical protein